MNGIAALPDVEKRFLSFVFQGGYICLSAEHQSWRFGNQPHGCGYGTCTLIVEYEFKIRSQAFSV